MFRRSSINAAFLVIVIALASGCTSKVGDRVLNSRYVYAKGSVTPLRNVSARKKITGFIGCGFSREQFNEVYDEALAQDPAANILIDYSVTYKKILFPIIFICTNELVISGLAAHAEIE